MAMGVKVKELPLVRLVGSQTFNEKVAGAVCNHCGKTLAASEAKMSMCDKCWGHGYDRPVTDERVE